MTTSVFNNISNKSSLKKELTRAFFELSEILKHHAGPFASNCVIGSKWRQVNDIDEFTKDGIKILRHLLVSEDPIFRFAARMVRFVGIAVDNRCHDGTTTSMLLFCRLAIISLQKLEGEFLSNDAYKWSLEIKTLLVHLMNYIETLKITDEDIFKLCQDLEIETTIEDVRAAMGYHMSMISSKGDHDLSSKIAFIIKSTPKKIHGMFKDTPLAVETREPYILKKQPYDISINANIGNFSDYNHMNDTQYRAENVVIFATGNQIVSNSFESGFLQSFISKNPRVRADLEPTFGVTQGWEELCKGTRNLVIMTPMLNDPNLIESILHFNKDNPGCKISWFNLQIAGRATTTFNKTLHYIAGKPLFQTTIRNASAALIGLDGPSVTVQCLGNVLALTGLYEKDGGVFHPFYNDEEAFLPYTLFRKETEDLIAFAMENVANPLLEQEELTYITHLYRILTVQDIYDIEIGGSSHDQYANRSVYEDAIGASLSAVTEGVVLGGYAHLVKMFKDYYDNGYLFEAEEDLTEGMYKAISSIVADSLRVGHDRFLNEKLCSSISDKYDYIAVDSQIDTGDGYLVSKYSLDRDRLVEFLKMTRGSPILLQAYAGYEEQFRRFYDILPRLANTTHLSDMRIRDDDVR